MNHWSILFFVSLTLTSCSKTESTGQLGKLGKIEVFLRPAPLGQQQADLFLYRLSGQKRVIVCEHWSGMEISSQETQQLAESIKRWRKLSATYGTEGGILLDATSFAYKNGTIYGGEVNLIFYPDTRSVPNMRSVDFSWEKYPSGGVFYKISSGAEVKSSDKLLASFDVDCNAILRTRVETSSKEVATGP